AGREAVEAVFLRDVGLHAERLAAGRATRPAERQPGDPFGGGQVPVEGAGGQGAGGGAVEAVRRLVGREEGGGVDVEVEQILHRAPVLRAGQTSQRVAAAGIRGQRVQARLEA